MPTELTPALSPAGSWVVWMGNEADARHAIKVTLISLIARGHVRVGEVEVPGIFRPRVQQGMSTTAKLLADAPPDIASVFAAVRETEARSDRDMAGLVKTLAERFGTGFKRFLYEEVAPRLEARGLIRLVPRTFLGFERWPAIEHTAAGEAERQRIAAQLREAEGLRALLRTDPVRAAAMAIALGGLVYLASDLWPVFGELGQAIGRHYQSADTATIAGPGGDSGGGAPPPEPAFERFDTAALGGLDSAMASFDSSFDAAADAGGDSGGGDGGGD